ncbi:YheC/YheD family protein [uncultured Metabacillus sp.]|uniref:YheC/YheD family endospore coat-associated protein n=1 Tax=uncultured Metabacillus sp. TaxID=2860135 RepID=UPI0026340698|nr:YheC/YheD family protein [uncultured Metabacillus sp.]
MKNASYFPLVGILSSPGKTEDSFRGNLKVFKAIQKELTKIGGLSFIFTTNDFNEHDVNGYFYYEHADKWGKRTFPIPDLIYNKISFRKEESSALFLSLKQTFENDGKYFFNPCFFDKWEVYLALVKSTTLNGYLPKTWMFTTINDVLEKLNTYHSLYVKPVNGHKGQGVYKLSYDGTSYYIHKKNQTINYVQADFVQDTEKLLMKKPYLLQKEIQTDTIDDCKYDLRILCLYEKGVHKIIGIGVRKADENSIITHVPNGGEIIPFQQVQDRCSEDKLDWLAETVGRQLIERYGFVGEFSMDVGITPQGEPILFEVNSKPMIFDEVDIQTKRIERTVKLFADLANSTSQNKKEF